MDAFPSCLFLQYDLEKALALKERRKDIRILIKPKNEVEIAQILTTLQPEAIHSFDEINTKEINEQIRQKGVRVFLNSLWVLNKKGQKNPDAFQQVYQNGANMIQTDHPVLLIQYLRSKNRHK